MTDSLRPRLLAAFAVEHREHIGALRDLLARAEAGGWALDRESLVEMHRRFHSLKGASRAVDFRAVEQTTHRAESAVERLQSGALALSADVGRVLATVVDEVEAWIAAETEGRAPRPLASVDGALAALLGGGTAPSSTPSVRPNAAVEAVPSAAKQDNIDTVRVESGTLDRLTADSMALNVELDAQEALVRELRVATEGSSDPKLRELTHKLAAHAWRLRAQGARLGEAVLQSRTVIAESVLFDLGRQAREMARELGKDVAVQVTGLNLSVDRSVLQGLKDPLLHLVRNALVHGIESPAERRARGKPERGRLSVSLTLRRRSLEIRVADDGQGLDTGRIAERAQALGLDSTFDAEAGGAALLRSLVYPGLSTADRADTLAGRGMGLSIVHEAVRRLGGYLDVISRPGEGVEFLIITPSTAARRRLMSFSIAGRSYALPLDCIARVRHVTPDAIAQRASRRALRVEGTEIPIVVPAATERAANDRIHLIEVKFAATHYAIEVDELGEIVDRTIEDPGLAGAAADAITGCVLLDGSILAPVLNPVWLETLVESTPIRSDPVRAAPRRRTSILIADDSITTRTLEKTLLEARGYDVLVSVDGADALAKLETNHVDVVVSDVEMPRSDGFALVQAMKGDKRFAEIPIILVTSRDTEADKRRGLALGADAYIVKQRFDERELVEAIEQFV